MFQQCISRPKRYLSIPAQQREVCQTQQEERLQRRTVGDREQPKGWAHCTQGTSSPHKDIFEGHKKGSAWNLKLDVILSITNGVRSVLRLSHLFTTLKQKGKSWAHFLIYIYQEKPFQSLSSIMLCYFLGYCIFAKLFYLVNVLIYL